MKRLKIDLILSKPEGFFMTGNSVPDVYDHNTIMICESELRAYFDIKGSNEVTIILSDKPSTNSYKVCMNENSLIFLDTDDQNEYWIMDFTTNLIAKLRPEILTQPFYVSVEY